MKGNKDIGPINVDAEMKALGCGYLSTYALEKMSDELSPDMFSDSRHVIIYNAMIAILNRKDKMDLTILKNEIEKVKTIKEVGGVDYLTEVIDSVVSVANIDTYISIIRDKSVRRNLINVCENIEVSSRDETQDTYSIIESAEKKIFEVTKGRKTTEFKTSAQVVENTKKQIEQLAKNDSDITGLPTGFAKFDKMTSGFHPNELIIIAARPAMGKTAFALNIAVNSAKLSNKSVAIFNLEMSAEQLMLRMLSSEGAIDGPKLKTGRLNHEDKKSLNQALSIIGDLPIYMEDTPGITIGEIRAKCRRLASKSDLGLIVIDYLQLISGGPGYGRDRQQEVSDISRSLKTMAMELGVPVVALAQLSRNVEGREDKKPIMSDLRESGSIEQDADIVAFLYRQDYYDKTDQDSDFSESQLIIAKHRSGATGIIKLDFNRVQSRFDDHEERNN